MDLFIIELMFCNLAPLLFDLGSAHPEQLQGILGQQVLSRQILLSLGYINIVPASILANSLSLSLSLSLT